MAGGDDDAAVGFLLDDRHLRRRGRGEAEVDHVNAHALQRTADQAVHNIAGDTGVAPDHHAHRVSFLPLFKQESGESRCKFHDIDGCKVLADSSSDGSAYSGNGLNKCHISLYF